MTYMVIGRERIEDTLINEYVGYLDTQFDTKKEAEDFIAEEKSKMGHSDIELAIVEIKLTKPEM